MIEFDPQVKWAHVSEVIAGGLLVGYIALGIRA